MDEINQIAFAEVMYVLKHFDRSSVMKIPVKLLEYFNKNQKKDLVINIDKEDIFNKNNISKEALAILAYIDLEYWCVDENEKKAVKQVYIENQKKYETDLTEKYGDMDIFNKKNTMAEDKVIAPKETSMIKYKKDNIFIKFKNIIINIIIKKKN